MSRTGICGFCKQTFDIPKTHRVKSGRAVLYHKRPDGSWCAGNAVLVARGVVGHVNPPTPAKT